MVSQVEGGDAVTLEVAWEIGRQDGEQIAWEILEAGGHLATGGPRHDFDGDLVSALGRDETCRLLGEDPAESADGWSGEMLAKLRAYNDGASAGAEATSRGWGA